MTFHMTDSQRMLAPVAQITEAGNRVNFSDESPNEHFIECRKTGKRIQLRKEGNVYVFYVAVDDGVQMKQIKIIVDSGAAENVMPRSWPPNVPSLPNRKGIQCGRRRKNAWKLWT